MFVTTDTWDSFEKNMPKQYRWIIPLVREVGLSSPSCGKTKDDYIDLHWFVEGIENRVRVWDDTATMAFGPVTFFGGKIKVGGKDLANLSAMNKLQQVYALLFTKPDVTTFSPMVKDFTEKFAALAKKI